MNKFNNAFSYPYNFNENGECFESFQFELPKKIDDSADRDHTILKAKEIFSCCLPKHSPKDKRVGLVVGRVQSGKTTSFTAVTALAADNGYAAIIHLLGTNLNLKDDNKADVAVALKLNGYDMDESQFHVVEVQPKSKGGLTHNEIAIDDKDIANLMDTSPRDEYDTRETKTIYYPLLKNYKSIDLLIKHLRLVFKELNDARPILIIDDEVDSYSLNTRNPDDPDATTTYTSLKRLFDLCEIVTYIGYTATAFANLCAHSTSFLNPQFHVVIDPGKEYVGNDKIFGVPDSMKTPKEIRSGINPHQAEKLDLLVLDNKTGEYEIDWKNKAIDSLEDAICNYLVSTVALMKRRLAKNAGGPRKKPKPTSMMLHPDRHVEKHAFIEKKLKIFLGQLDVALQNPNKVSPALIKLKSEYDKKKKNVFSYNQVSFPSYNDVIQDLRDKIFANNRYSIHVLNADKLYGRKNISRVEWGKTPLHFCIGSVSLSRGYVVNQLITSWMPNEPKTLIADVTEQRMRCCGYKEEFLDLISVYVQPDTFQLMKDYSLTESRLLQDLKDAAIDGHTVHEVAGTIHGITRLTAGNKCWRTTKNHTISWATPLHSMFGTSANKQCIHNSGFREPIRRFIKLNANKFLKVSKNNPYGATTPFQRFDHCTFKLDRIYKELIQPLAPYVSHQDLSLEAMLKEVMPKDLNTDIDCDIVIFNHGTRMLAQGCINGKVDNFQFGSNYYSGSGGGYVGDRQVISVGSFDPTTRIKNYKHNTKYTIHIHKFNEIKEWTPRGQAPGPVYLKNAYALQVHSRLAPVKVQTIF